MQEMQEMLTWFPGWEAPLEEENGNSLQCSGLKNSMDRGAWWATTHKVAKSQTQLKWLSRHAENPEQDIHTAWPFCYFLFKGNWNISKTLVEQIDRSLIFWCLYWIKDFGSQISVTLQKYVIGEIYRKKVEKKRGSMYSYSWFTLLDSRN